MASYHPILWLFHFGFVASLTGSSMANDNKIIGGILAPKMAFMANIQRNNLSLCCGSLLSLSHVLTACHCVGTFSSRQNSKVTAFKKISGPGSLKILAGHPDLQTSSNSLQTRRSVSLHYHPKCKVVGSAIGEWDFAVIVTNMPFKRTAHVRPLKLFSLKKSSFEKRISAITDQSRCWVMGWGRDNVAGDPPVSRHLRMARMRIVPVEECRTMLTKKLPEFKSYDFATRAQMCALGVNESESDCIGDSGGPFICDGDVIGIVSYGFECGQGDSPAVYAKLSEFVEWYKEMKSPSERASSGSKVLVYLIIVGGAIVINLLTS
ncbi:Tryp_SPc [Nesidiocoris tenuis]|uniref:Tryp_SPc n=2 Tax=Nesidiocoris tenuis TaxID=355587 RepID=A0ABN7BDY2_9HEMI|nr:Tryp_SPc [Nesidiocoris tenuis]